MTAPGSSNTAFKPRSLFLSLRPKSVFFPSLLSCLCLFTCVCDCCVCRKEEAHGVRREDQAICANIKHRPGSTHAHTNAHTQVLDVSTVTASAAVDLFLLAEGDMFVGAFGSHMSRLAFELLVGLRGRVVPYVSGQRPPAPPLVCLFFCFVTPPPSPRTLLALALYVPPASALYVPPRP